MHLAIRADGRAGSGFGHLARGLALAQAWLDDKGTVTIASDGAPQEWLERYRDEGARVVAEDELSSAAWTVLDGYRFGPADHEHVRANGSRLLVIDDHGHAGRYIADAVLDQNLGASAASYDDRLPETALLLGPRYALLRREFRSSSRTVRPVPDRARAMLIALGGSPPDGARTLVEGAMASMQARGSAPSVEWLTGTRDVAARMAEADVALSAAGSTVWELCAMSVPSLLVALAENQVPVARAMGDSAAALNLGRWRELTPDGIAAEVERLLADRSRREELARAARDLVDGRGATRVAAHLRAALLDLREAAPSDARLLWEWANDRVVRDASFSPEPISWDTHAAWFEARLNDRATKIFIASIDDCAVGQVRFDVDGLLAEIDVSVDGQERGRGLGPALIIAGVRELFGRTEAGTVVARVRPENTASATAFEDADFLLEGERSDGGRTWLHYARSRDDR